MTNELLLKRFKSQFDLVRCAIAEAERRVAAGKDYVHADTENMATEILCEMAEGKDRCHDPVSDQEVSCDEENPEIPEEE